MRLYLAPGACSQADHIALNEAGMAFDTVKVDIPNRRTETGEDFEKINAKGYVPALVLDDGSLLTENTAILAWIADEMPALAPDGPRGRIRLIEMLAFIASEIHKPFIRTFFPTSDKDGKVCSGLIAKRFTCTADQMAGDYLFGDRFTTADAYLYVMLRWAAPSGMDIPARLKAFADRVSARPAVARTLKAEGLA